MAKKIFYFMVFVFAMGALALGACDDDGGGTTSQNNQNNQTNNANNATNNPSNNNNQTNNQNNQTNNANNSSATCGEDPPEAPADLQCSTWSCDVVAYPECFSCEALPDTAQDGDPCIPEGESEATGQCDTGVCVGSSVSDPGTTGPETVALSSFDLDLSGDHQGTTLTLQVAAPEAAGSYPVVLFMHGFMLSPDDYTTTISHLASWGYVVVAPAFPGSMLTPTSHRVLKEYASQILDWVELVAGDSAGAIPGADSTKIVVAGHSMGGKIAFLLATEDARPMGVFGVDPVDAAGGFNPDPADYPSVTPELMDQITVPIVALGETTNATSTFGQACAPADDNFQQYYAHAVSPALEIEVLGANHMSFLDNPNCGMTCSVCSAGTDDPEETKALMRRYLTAFVNLTLKGQSAFATFLTGTQMAQDVAAGHVTSQSKNGF